MSARAKETYPLIDRTTGEFIKCVDPNSCPNGHRRMKRNTYIQYYVIKATKHKPEHEKAWLRCRDCNKNYAALYKFAPKREPYMKSELKIDPFPLIDKTTGSYILVKNASFCVNKHKRTLRNTRINYGTRYGGERIYSNLICKDCSNVSNNRRYRKMKELKCQAMKIQSSQTPASKDPQLQL